MIILVGKNYKIHIDKYCYKVTKEQKTKKDLVCGKEVKSDVVSASLGYFTSLKSALQEIIDDLKDSGKKYNDIMIEVEKIYSSIVSLRHQSVRSKIKDRDNVIIKLDNEYTIEIDDRQFYLSQLKETKKRLPSYENETGERIVDVGFYSNIQRAILSVIHGKINDIDKEIDIKDLLPIIKNLTVKYNSLVKEKIKEEFLK